VGRCVFDRFATIITDSVDFTLILVILFSHRDDTSGVEMSDNLTGGFHVRATRPAFADVGRLFKKTRDSIEVRRHALKLRYWPDAFTTEASGQVFDLDWSWIRSLEGTKIGELRIHDTIGGQDNLRVIFFLGPQCDRVAKRCIWILAVIQKRRDDFTAHQIRIFADRRLLVLQRFYEEWA
jgi:hypothetical protein